MLNKMKKRNPILLFIVTWCNITILCSQKLYTDIDVGFGLGISKQDFEDFYDYNYCDEEYSYNQRSISLGQGFNMGVSFGNMFSENIGVEVGIVSFFSDCLPYTDQQTEICKEEDDTIICSCFHNIREDYFYVHLFGYTASFILETEFKGVDIYAKFGLIAVHGVIKHHIESSFFDEHKVWEYTGGLSLGIDASLGVNVMLLPDKLSVFGELNTVNVSYAPTKGELIKLDIEGKNRLHDITRHEKEIEFVDHYSYDEDYIPPDSEPRKELKKYYPFSTFGLKLGFKYTLIK